MHSSPDFWDESWTGSHGDNIKNLLKNFDCKNILDFGSGKGNQYFVDKIHTTYFDNIMPVLYDPGVKEFDILPDGKFDLVLCTDVLEHIPENLLPIILEQIYNKASKCVYLGICNSRSESKLPDGRDVHLTKKRGNWWINKVKPFASVYTHMYVYGQLGSCIAEFDSKGLKKIPVFDNNDNLKKLGG